MAVVGVLAIQGDVEAHLRMLKRAGAESHPVRHPTDLDRLEGLIIPGGESTVIGDGMQTWGWFERLPSWLQNGGVLWGTCAGAILMSSEIAGARTGQPFLDLLPVRAHRNGFGRQIFSFETDLQVTRLGPAPVPAVFIRAPYFEPLTQDERPLEILAEHDGRIVAVQSRNRYLATAFHPELTDDIRFHQYFLNMI